MCELASPLLFVYKLKSSFKILFILFDLSSNKLCKNNSVLNIVLAKMLSNTLKFHF